MGMFDRVRCEMPLPDGWVPDELQTKDFDCEMVEHLITKDGRLMLDRGHYEEVPLSERPYTDAPEGDLRRLVGSIRRIPKMIDADFHGFVNFYGIEITGYEQGRPIYKIHDYRAKFTDGQLVMIEICGIAAAAKTETKP